MAGYRAIAAVSQAVVAVLEEAAGAPGSELADLAVALVQGGRLAEGMSSGLSVHLHHVSVSRATSPRPPEGEGRPASLMVDLHYLLTAWAETPVLQQRLLGWCLRTLDASLVLPGAALQREGADVFGPTETVRLELEPLRPAELRALWPVADSPLPPSLTYLVRSVPIR